MRANRVAILYDGLATNVSPESVSCKSGGADQLRQKCLNRVARQFRIAHGVLDIAVAQISVKRPRICLLLAEAKQQASETYRGSAMRAKPSGVGLLGPQRDTPMHLSDGFSVFQSGGLPKGCCSPQEGRRRKNGRCEDERD